MIETLKKAADEMVKGTPCLVFATDFDRAINRCKSAALRGDVQDFNGGVNAAIAILENRAVVLEKWKATPEIDRRWCHEECQLADAAIEKVLA